MARVTVEDCVDKLPNRFDLVLAAAHQGERLAPGRFVNAVTLSTVAHSTEYEPGAHMEFISPTPLLMIVATDDTITPTDLALAAYARALEPKQLVLLPGDHFVPYQRAFDRASSAARDWLVQHLLQG